MKKFVKNLSVVSLVAVSAFALASCASNGGGCGSDCSKTCCSKKACAAGCTAACCAPQK